MEIDCDRAAFQHHAISLVRTLCGSVEAPATVRRGAPISNGISLHVDGGQARVVEPRDYAHGVIRITRGGRTVSSHAESSTVQLSLVREGDWCRGFQIDDVFTPLSVAESGLIGSVGPEDTIVSRMLEIKRVGLARQLENVGSGKPSWTFEQSMNDVLVNRAAHGRSGYTARH